MKTRFIIMMLACAAMFSFSSCSEDEKEPFSINPKEIIGVWETYDSPEVVLVWTFGKDGVCVQRVDLYMDNKLMHSKTGKEQNYKYYKYYVLIGGKRHDCTIEGGKMRISDGEDGFFDMIKVR